MLHSGQLSPSKLNCSSMVVLLLFQIPYILTNVELVSLCMLTGKLLPICCQLRSCPLAKKLHYGWCIEPCTQHRSMSCGNTAVIQHRVLYITPFGKFQVVQQHTVSKHIWLLPFCHFGSFRPWSYESNNWN